MASAEEADPGFLTQGNDDSNGAQEEEVHADDFQTDTEVPLDNYQDIQSQDYRVVNFLEANADDEGPQPQEYGVDNLAGTNDDDEGPQPQDQGSVSTPSQAAQQQLRGHQEPSGIEHDDNQEVMDDYGENSFMDITQDDPLADYARGSHSQDASFENQPGNYEYEDDFQMEITQDDTLPTDKTPMMEAYENNSQSSITQVDPIFPGGSSSDILAHGTAPNFHGEMNQEDHLITLDGREANHVNETEEEEEQVSEVQAALHVMNSIKNGTVQESELLTEEYPNDDHMVVSPEEAQPDVSEDSLFVPEKTPPRTVPPVSSKMPPPSRAPAPLSFTAIRAINKKLQGSKVEDKRRTESCFGAGARGISASVEPGTNAPINYDEENKRAEMKFLKAKKHYEDLRKKNGSLTFREDIELTNIKKAEQVHINKRKREGQKLLDDETEEGQVSFCFPGREREEEEEEEVEEEQLVEDYDVRDDPRSSNKRRKPNMPLKPAKHHQSLQDAEYQSMMVSLEADGDLFTKKSNNLDLPGTNTSQAEPPTSGKSKSKSRSRTSKQAKPKTSSPGKKDGEKAPRQTAKRKREEQQQMNQMSTLLTGNVFEDQADQDAADQPTFTSTNKNVALKELISSVAPENIKATKTDTRVLLNATRDFDGIGSVRADGKGLWIVKGMSTSLKPYQILGTAFMRRRENSTEEPRGGLLADQMGLGKTLMMLANIVNGRPARGEPIKTTLIVASPNLLTQWAGEIKTHVDTKLSIMRYGAGTRIDSSLGLDIITRHDIVLTTYHEIMRSYPKNEPPIECQTAEQKINWWKDQYENNRGVLHRIQFYRIVLDEAQAIKNYQGRTSIACRAMMATHRWALSGTPILNCLQELYPYFKFLRVPHTGSLRIFKNNYCDTSNPENADRLLLRLGQFMLRRTHADMMFGVPILKLPKAGQAIQWCDFNPVERSIYDIIRKRFVERINVWSRTGQLEKSYSNVLVMLLRLRQLTAHVLMLQFVMRDLLERDDIEKIRDIVNDRGARDDTGGYTILAIRKQLEALAKEPVKDNNAQDSSIFDDEDEDILKEEDNTPFGSTESGNAFGKDYEFKPYLNSLTIGDSWDKAKKKATCCSCNKHVRTMFLTDCHHLYCEGCYNEAALKAAESENMKAQCKKCGQAWERARPCHDNGYLEDPQQYAAPSTRATKRGKESERFRPEREDIKDDWLSIGGHSMLPSAKTIAIKAQILNWITENPGVKIIIYTQFLPMIKILNKICAHEGWAVEQYHGKMSYPARDKAIDEFGKNPEIRVLLASLRCGGLGLNLTMASRVILVDPWWNSAAEQQAFCRVFRIGQVDTTFMTRFFVKDSVDDRIHKMQLRKEKEINEIMDDDGERVKKLTLRDLMRLFGAVDDDPEGKPYILVDNPDPQGGFRADPDHEGYADEM